jgi:ATP cone domain
MRRLKWRFAANLSFPGSAWERTACEALPRVRCGLEAEPPGQCVPRQSLGTRGSSAGVIRGGSPLIMDIPPATPPAWVQKRDGRLESFDADKISRALFAASESLGRPDAFLARELTDGAVHFLTAESDGTTPTTAQIAELVAKVVRELGQPSLAAAYTAHGLQRDHLRIADRADLLQAEGRTSGDDVLQRIHDGMPSVEGVREYTLQSVFARDLAAAHCDGLLTLTGLESPCELAGCILGPPVAKLGEDDVAAALEKARGFAGAFVALDGPEYLLAQTGRTGEPDADAFARDLALGLHLQGLRAVVNLNGATAPSWAGDLAEGPLFAGQRLAPAPELLAQLADSLARELVHLEAAKDRLCINWHLSEHDIKPENADRLTGLARLALDGAPLGFVFDRPRRPVLLAPGVDRRHPAVLLTVGVHLPRLAEQMGVDGDSSRFLKKLESLARLALSAAVQKREFLRRQNHFSSGFLLDRARLVVAPVGLDAVVQRFTGRGLSSGGAPLEFGKQIVQTLRDVLRRDGGLTRLATCLDGPDDFRLAGDGSPAAQVAGLTPWDGVAQVKNQLRAAGALHALAEGGTAALFLPEEPRPTAEVVADWLRMAWKQSEVMRLRLMLQPSSMEAHG